MTPGRRERTSGRSGRRRLSRRRLAELVDEAIVDAYGKSEQRVGLLSMIQMNLACPFETEILGVQARVERVDLNDAEEIVAVCRRGRERRTIPILDLPLPSPQPAGWEWIEAYRHWARGGRWSRLRTTPGSRVPIFIPGDTASLCRGSRRHFSERRKSPDLPTSACRRQDRVAQFQ